MDRIEREMWITVSMIIIFSLVFVTTVAIIGSKAEDESKNECEKVGGKYEVVDTTYSSNVFIDIYGCVK